MNPTQVHPALAANMGWDIEALNDMEKVTLVRRRVVYEELVMTKSEFDLMNEKNKNWNEDEEFYLSKLEMKDIGFPDFTNEQTEYIAFPGDVTFCTDDAIALLYPNQEWIDGFGSEYVKIAS